MKKFLVCGCVEGHFDQLNQKIESLLKKGQQFDFLICVGSSLSLDFQIKDYIQNKKRFPIKTYFIDSSELSQCIMQKVPYMQELCPNFVFLGRSGIRQIEGLDICFISGIQSHHHQEFYSQDDLMKTQFTGPYFTQNDIQQIENDVKQQGANFKGVDIFLSNEWPFGFENNTKFNKISQINSRSLKISQLADLVSPRYHFAAQNGVYYARPPYLNRFNIMTRFIALGKISGGGTEKYLSAFQIQPLKEMTKEELKVYTEDTTQNPYTNSQFIQPYKEFDEDEMEEENNNLNQIEKEQQIQQRQEKYQDKTKQLEENCTLYVGQFDKQTTADDIADFISRWGQIEDLELVYDEKTKKAKGYGFVKFKYLETTQQAIKESGLYSLHGQKIQFKIKSGEKGDFSGQQNDAVCWFCVNSPDMDKSLVFYEGQDVYLALDKGPITENHFLIIPNEHVRNYTSLSNVAQKEIEDLKQKMNKIMVNNYNKTLLCFERYMKLQDNKAHMIIHCVPIDIGKTENFRQKFENGVRAHRLNFFKIRKDEFLDEFVAKDEFYFYMELYGQDRYLYAFKEGTKFHYDFGRQIICEIFSISRANWKDCIISERDIFNQIKELQFQLNK